MQLCWTQDDAEINWYKFKKKTHLFLNGSSITQFLTINIQALKNTREIKMVRKDSSKIWANFFPNTIKKLIIPWIHSKMKLRDFFGKTMSWTKSTIMLLPTFLSKFCTTWFIERKRTTLCLRRFGYFFSTVPQLLL